MLVEEYPDKISWSRHWMRLEKVKSILQGGKNQLGTGQVK